MNVEILLPVGDYTMNNKQNVGTKSDDVIRITNSVATNKPFPGKYGSDFRFNNDLNYNRMLRNTFFATTPTTK